MDGDYGLVNLRESLETASARSSIASAVQAIRLDVTDSDIDTSNSLESRHQGNSAKKNQELLASYLTEVTEDLREYRRDTMHRLRILFFSLLYTALSVLGLVLAALVLAGLEQEHFAYLLASLATSNSVGFGVLWRLYKLESGKGEGISGDLHRLEEARLAYLLRMSENPDSMKSSASIMRFLRVRDDSDSKLTEESE